MNTPQPGDVFNFLLSDATYRAMICADAVDEDEKSYYFVPVTGSWLQPPTISDILNSQLTGVRIVSTMGRERTAAMQPGVERFWDAQAGSPPFFIGLGELICMEKNWETISGKIERIGELNFIAEFNSMGALQHLDSFSGLEIIFADVVKYFSHFEWQFYPVNMFCVKP